MTTDSKGVFQMEFTELYRAALEVLNPRRISPDIEVGGVAAALVTDRGNVYRGVCIDTACSMGFCAEHAAIAAMVTAGESRVEKIVAVNWDKKILPPCGRCREFLMQLGNPDTLVLVAENTAVKVQDLLPFYWQGGES
jgi:cytidine deaminase